MKDSSPFRVVSHPRSGTHLLLHLLWHNFHTRVAKPIDLFHGHDDLPADSTISIHVERALPDVMISMYRLRDRFGFSRSISFADFIRRPSQDLPRTVACDVFLDGDRVTEVSAWPTVSGLTLPENWRRTVCKFRAARVQVSYGRLVSEPINVLEELAAISVPRKDSPTLIQRPVGWSPANLEDVQPTDADWKLLYSFACPREDSELTNTFLPHDDPA